MKVRFDRETDTLTIYLRAGSVSDTEEPRPGILMDYDDWGQLLSIEILEASQRVEEPEKLIGVEE
jgi:uncharacterized protein YuzE